MIPNGCVFYEGPSLLNSEQVIAIATGIRGTSNNRKTGRMIQTWILHRDTKPSDALRSGEDVSVCGLCIHRPALKPDAPCYVVVGQAPNAIWKAFHADKYPRLEIIPGELPIRFGSYGDPAAIPDPIWEKQRQALHTGYTHQWTHCDGQRTLSMASVDNEEEYWRAKERQWRTFRVMGRGEVPLPSEILCPASEEAGLKTTCIECGLCDGSRAVFEGTTDRRKDIAIYAH